MPDIAVVDQFERSKAELGENYLSEDRNPAHDRFHTHASDNRPSQ